MARQNTNNIVVSGHLVKDAELDHVGSKETAILKFSIGNNRGYGDYEKVNYFDVKFWGKGAEAIAEYMVKGKGVTITGEIEQEKWTDKDSGNNRSKVVVKALQIELMPRGESGSAPKAEEIKNDDIRF